MVTIVAILIFSAIGIAATAVVISCYRAAAARESSMRRRSTQLTKELRRDFEDLEDLNSDDSKVPNSFHTVCTDKTDKERICGIATYPYDRRANCVFTKKSYTIVAKTPIAPEGFLRKCSMVTIIIPSIAAFL